MTAQRGSDFLLKIGDGGDPEVFSVLGAARTTALIVHNSAIDATDTDSGGLQKLEPLAGIQQMSLSVDGIFKDTAAEERLRTAAFGRLALNYQMAFPNGDTVGGAFFVEDYRRGGTFDGLETFSATFVRSGPAAFTAGA